MLNNNDDGVKFINIYSKAKTSLGKQLTNMYHYTFIYDGIQFISVEQAWHFYKFSKYPELANQILQFKNSFDCLKFARANQQEDASKSVQSPVFRLLMQDVIRTRIDADIDLKNQLRNSWLPFEHYYAYGDKVQDQRDKYEWLINIFEDYRTELQFEYLDDLLSKYGNLCYNMRTAPANAIYAGRPKAGQTAVYGNPFPVVAFAKALKGTDNHNLFDIAVAKSVIEFRAYLIKEIMKSPDLWYQRLTEIKHKPLKCFCTNGTDSRDKGAAFCHTLVLAQFADNLDSIYAYLGIKNVHK